ncbi:MAG: hypothetical protein QOF56_3853 [Acidobacteriaceae bacterium]|nr:hypothetical protein [Acidobacteriaceae bacterium]
MQRVSFAFTTILGLALMFVSNAAVAQYQLTNLDSNQVRAARHTDPLLVNGWGLVHAPGSPWWVSDNSSGWSTLYDNKGVQVQTLKVLIPTAGENGPGLPTGIVWNPSTSSEFKVQGWASVFLFATLDGTISGWAPQSNFNAAIVAVNNASTGSVYTGLAITNKPSGNFLYAADLANNKVDIYDGTFTLVKSFTDTTLPSGFAPFGIRDVNGLVYVAFANVAGGAGGFIDVFNEDGTPVIPGKHLIEGFPLNQPWGIAVAPRNFGRLSNTLLISNNTDRGTINAFDGLTGQFVGRMRDEDGKVIVIDQLWGIDFGDGKGANGNPNELFFTAGPSGNLAGTFGVIHAEK